MSFEDRISEVVQGILSDSTQLPAEFINSLPQIVAQNPVPTAKTSGQRVAHGTQTSNVSTAGTTFAGGADILSTALSFSAVGGLSYVLKVIGAGSHNNTASQINQLNLNLDGADGGVFWQTGGIGTAVHFALSGAAYFTPSAGNHTINARLVVTGGTGTLDGGSGGAGAYMPIVVTLEVA